MKAFEWYETAALQGDSSGQFCLAYLYENGDGVEQDHLKALEWFEKSATQGNENAQHCLGIMYTTGKSGVHKAFEWFEKSAVQGYGDAQFCLGAVFGLGHGMDVSFVESYEWIYKAACKGSVYANQFLGDHSIEEASDIHRSLRQLANIFNSATSKIK